MSVVGILKQIIINFIIGIAGAGKLPRVIRVGLCQQFGGHSILTCLSDPIPHFRLTFLSVTKEEGCSSPLTLASLPPRWQGRTWAVLELFE